MKLTEVMTFIILIFIPVFAFGQKAVSASGKLIYSDESKSILEIRTPQNLNCDIKVETHAKNTVEGEYRMWARAKSSTQEQRFIDLIEIQINDRSNKTDGILLRVLTPTRAPWEGTDYGVGVELDILVPDDFMIESHNSYSTIEFIGPFKGVEINNEYGSIKVEDVTGELVVKASYSPVELYKIKGFVSIETRYGGITCQDIIITKGSGVFETSYGPIKLVNIKGSIEAYTSYDKISANNIDAGSGSVILTTSYSPIEAENITGELVCETSYNSINLSNIFLTHGMNKIETKYAPVNVIINDMNESQLLINNTYSSINLSLESNISAKLMLTVDDGGKIHTRGFSIKPLAMDRNRLVGIVGDGLSKIELNVDGIGEINIDSQ